MFTSKETAEMETVCGAGVESYLSTKHKEHLKAGVETGVLGAFIGGVLTITYSYLDKSGIIKPQHSWMPALVGLSGGVISAYVTMEKYDDQHRGRFCRGL